MEDKRKKVEEELVDALGSEGRIRILKTLAEKPNNLFTTYALAKCTRLRRQDVNKILNILCNIGWVKYYQYGVKKYQINMEKEGARRLTDFFKAIEII